MDTSFLILFGIREASIMNAIATIGKLVPIVLFIVVMVTAFAGTHLHMIFGRRNDLTFRYTWSSEKYNACNTLGFHWS